MTRRFHTTRFETGEALLDGSERDHCIRVLRTSVGDVVEVVDGKGHLYHGALSAFDKHKAVIRLEGPPEFFAEPPLPVIACAVPKNRSRWEWFLEKSVEIGVHRIVPLMTRRSEKQHIRRDRCEQILRSAFKQSGRYYLPALDEPVSLEEFLKAIPEGGQRFIGHCGDGMKTYLGDVYRTGRPVAVMIGPEGDFSEDEVGMAIRYGAVPVHLGTARLRVETAAVSACAIIQCMENLHR